MCARVAITVLAGACRCSPRYWRRSGTDNIRVVFTTKSSLEGVLLGLATCLFDLFDLSAGGFARVHAQIWAAVITSAMAAAADRLSAVEGPVAVEGFRWSRAGQIKRQRRRAPQAVQ